MIPDRCSPELRCRVLVIVFIVRSRIQTVGAVERSRSLSFLKSNPDSVVRSTAHDLRRALDLSPRIDGAGAWRATAMPGDRSPFGLLWCLRCITGSRRE